MKVKDLKKILNECDEESQVRIGDSSTPSNSSDLEDVVIRIHSYFRDGKEFIQRQIVLKPVK